jgi:ribonuclease PH
MKRTDGRSATCLRKTRLVRSVLRQTHGSALIKAGNTQVLCAATVEEKVPAFLRGAGQGWITAEYAMLPGSGSERVPRNRVSGRGMEIQRLVGRSLRSVVDLTRLGERTITLDCDVLEADGGTRTAAITAAFVALREAIDWLMREGRLSASPVIDSVAAISVGRVEDRILLDLCREEDTQAEVDFNLVATGSGQLVEVQGTAEKGTFSAKDLQRMVQVGLKAVGELTALQEKCLRSPPRKMGVLLVGGRNASEGQE